MDAVKVILETDADLLLDDEWLLRLFKDETVGIRFLPFLSVHNNRLHSVLRQRFSHFSAYICPRKLRGVFDICRIAARSKFLPASSILQKLLTSPGPIAPLHCRWVPAKRTRCRSTRSRIFTDNFPHPVAKQLFVIEVWHRDMNVNPVE